MSITSIIGPPLMNNVFAFFTNGQQAFYFPGAAMVLGAVIMLISSVLAKRTLKEKLL